MKSTGLLLIITGWVIILSLPSCRKNVETRPYEDVFDLGSLVDAQVIYLSGNHYGIRKVSGLGHQEEVTESYPDSTGWAKELSILKSADISKPGLRPYYSLETYICDSFLVDEYVVKDSSSQNTVSQRIIRDKNTGRLARLEAEQHVDNPIYHSNRHIKIVFNRQDGEAPVIDSIMVKGYQKMFFQDTVFYRTIAKITH